MKTKALLAFLMTGVMSVGMVSCGDDDEADEIGTTKVSSSAFYDIDGQRVQSVGYLVNCAYDNNGDLQYLSLWNDDYKVSNNPFKLTYDDRYSVREITATFNGSGYISSLKMSRTYYNNEYDKDDETTTASFSYNGNGQITKITMKSSEPDGYWSANGTATLTYSGTVLKKISAKVVEKEGKETYTINSTYEFVYQSQYENKYQQYTPGYGRLFDEDTVGLFLIGMFGKASSQLPDEIAREVVETEDGEKDTHTSTLHWSYSFNSNGSIRNADGNNYYYVPVSTRAAVEVPEVPETSMLMEEQERPQSLFSLRRHSR